MQSAANSPHLSLHAKKMEMRIPFTVAFFVFLALLLKLVRGCYSTSSRPKQPPALRLPPGPWQLPLIGSLHHLLLSRFRDLPHRALREMSETYGPVMMLRFGSVPTLVVSSAEAAWEVTKTHDLAFCERHLGVLLDTMTYGGIDMIGSPYNAHWRELRKLCTVELLSQRRVLAFRNLREEEVAHLVRSISGECGDGRRPVNLSEGIHRMINDLSARTVIGNRCKYRDEYMHELEEVARLAAGFNLAELYPSSRLVRRFSTAATQARRCQRNMYRIIQSIILEREAMPPPPEGDEDLLDVLLRLKREGGLQLALTDEIVSAVIFDIFSAGSESTATILVWAISELVKNPRVMHKAQSEVRETFKGQDKINEGDLIKLSYLQLVIKEILRLHGPMSLPRKCRESCQVMGYVVPKGTMVFLNVWAISRDRKLWHNAEEFMPERFENTSIDFRGNDFKLTPFGAGRRICPGVTLALANIELTLANLLYHFDWALPDGVKLDEFDMAEAFGASLRRKSMLWLKAKPYNNFIPN